jgi:hypothetical protein
MGTVGTALRMPGASSWSVRKIRTLFRVFRKGVPHGYRHQSQPAAEGQSGVDCPSNRTSAPPDVGRLLLFGRILAVTLTRLPRFARFFRSAVVGLAPQPGCRPKPGGRRKRLGRGRGDGAEANSDRLRGQGARALRAAEATCETPPKGATDQGRRRPARVVPTGVVGTSVRMPVGLLAA